MPTLNIWNRLSYKFNVDNEITARHGDPDSGSHSIPHPITVAGEADNKPFSLADQTAKTLWDNDEDQPTGFLYLFVVVDQDCDLQLVGATQNVAIPLKADIPFVLADDRILSASNTTDVTGGAAVAYEDIDHIRLNNDSGSDAQGTFIVVL